TQNWITRPMREEAPIKEATTVYTDAGKKSRTAAATWFRDGTWNHHILKARSDDSLQTLELLAVVWTLGHFEEPLNIVTDSLYVAGIIQRIEDAAIRKVENRRLFELFV
ncbi:PO113 protein, partial [Chunga burmeisteri]|nr:PO113 protein [Chunga burmeisteri]